MYTNWPFVLTMCDRAGLLLWGRNRRQIIDSYAWELLAFPPMSWHLGKDEGAVTPSHPLTTMKSISSLGPNERMNRKMPCPFLASTPLATFSPFVPFPRPRATVHETYGMLHKMASIYNSSQSRQSQLHFYNLSEKPTNLILYSQDFL